MLKITDYAKLKERPIKVIQFGEGNFLRAFVDYFIQKLNDSDTPLGNVAIIKSIKQGTLEMFNAQNNLYSVVLRGKKNNKVVEDATIIDSISCAIDMHIDYNAYLKLAEEESVKFIISNTTEAGIVFNENDNFAEELNISYPAKLTKFLLNRYKKLGDKGGLYIIPCELIDNNADKLKECVDKYIDSWSLPEDFKLWNNSEVFYCNSLVDRIVTGYPKNNDNEIFNKLGYWDNLVTVAEPFGLWVIEEKGEIKKHFRANLPEIIFTNSVEHYKTRKVRLLNGAHTSLVPVAFLSGLTTVGDAMDDKIISSFVKNTLFNEIIPTVPLETQELIDFANAVIERFENPFVNHLLLSIALNSISKWRVRVLPSFREYYNKFNKLPNNLVLSLAFLIKMYSELIKEGETYKAECFGLSYNLNDDDNVLEFFSKNSKLSDSELADKTLSNKDFWGEDLTLYISLTDKIKDILSDLSKTQSPKAYVGDYNG